MPEQTQQYRVLANGQHIPIIGLGTFALAHTENDIKLAIDVGYRMFDTAYQYNNQSDIGIALKEKIDAGVVKRKDLFIIAKLASIHHEPVRVESALRDTLYRLNLSYVDLFEIHKPVSLEYFNEDIANSWQLSDVDYLDTWRAMEEMVDCKLARGLGINHFNAHQTDRLMRHCRYSPLVNHVEFHPCFNQRKLIEFSNRRNICIVAIAPLSRPKPEIKHPPFLFDEASSKMAAKYNKTPAQIALRWVLQMGAILTPRASSQHHMEENLDIFDFELSSNDMQQLENYHDGKRQILYSNYSCHKYYPFHTLY